MGPEQKTCQNCKGEFEIAPEDFAFFEKMEVEPPELCPRCGIHRAMTMRNDRTLYRRECDNCRKSSISLYHLNAPYRVYCHDCWWSDKWDGLTYGKDYDAERSLGEQFKDLQQQVPRESLIILNSINSDYGNNIRDSKDIYFSFQVAEAENIFYCVWVVKSKDCIAAHKVLEGERIAYSVNVNRCYNCTYLQDSDDCTDCHFSYDLRGCSNCLFSSNLRNKLYYIFNKHVSKEEYRVESEKVLSGKWSELQRYEEQYEEVKKKAIRKYQSAFKSLDSTGNYLQECNNNRWCFFGVKTEDSFAVANILNSKSVYYSYAVGPNPSEYLYGVSVYKGGSRCNASFNLFNCNDCVYSDSLVSCSECIGCVGLKNKQFCILNKQYSKEEYSDIKSKLRGKAELRSLLPISFSAFAYNETAAQDMYFLTKSEVEALGYTWQDDMQLSKGRETIDSDEIPDAVGDVGENLVKEILKCKNCERNYKITSQEIELSKKLCIPLSRFCPQCRIEKQLAQRSPFVLYNRVCQCSGVKSENHIYQNISLHFHGEEHCPNTFETAYSPEKSEIVYCEQCYQAEVV